MTLLIGTISQKHVVITADGLSRVNPATGGGLDSHAFQKIFPVPGLPVAFVHHGLNIIGGQSAGDFVADYIRGHGGNMGTASIEEVAQSLCSCTAQPAQAVLANPDNVGVVGFWIAGFGCGREEPELYEACWPGDPVLRSHKHLVLGGDGKEFIRVYLAQPLGSFRADRVYQYSVEDARQYHEALYSHAEVEQGKTGRIVFGGRQHQLVVERTGWKWIKPPT